MLIRLQKLIARYGLASRRKAEELISQGRVRVNGQVVDRLGAKVPEDASIQVDGRTINRDIGKLYLMMNKPSRYLCTRYDPRGRALVYELLPQQIRESGVFTVGRLDFNTEGLLLFTNDGCFAHAVGHPSAGTVKKYVVETENPIPYNLIDGWKNGVYIKGETYRIAGYKRVSSHKAVVLLVEGKNREIRRLFRYISVRINRLVRVSVGPLELGDLPTGEWRTLTCREREELVEEALHGGLPKQ